MAVGVFPQQGKTGGYFITSGDAAAVDRCIMKLNKASDGLYVEALKAATPDLVRRAVAQAIPEDSEG
jgi:hypothetical protein